MKIEVGKIFEGEITRIVEEGAFVDIGTLRKAVIPRSDLDKLDQHQLGQIQEGEAVEVYVTHAPQNGANPLVSVAQALLPEVERTPSGEENVEEKSGWAVVGDTYTVGDQVEGVVTHIRKYGAFVELPVGVEGLVHVSEMEPGYTHSPWDVVREGEKVLVEVIKIEPQRQRIGLSLLQTSS